MVSILVPVYNAAPYLRKCVGSITGQTYTDLQIVLINDGSTDGSWSIMQELAREDSRIEIYTQANRGVAATRNNLLERAKGDFVLFVDSDDWIESDTIKVLIAEQAKGDYDIVMYQYDDVHYDQAEYSRPKAVMLFLQHTIFRGMLWNKFVRRRLFDGIEMDDSISYGEDSLMTWYILQRIDKMVSIKRFLYHYNRNESSLSNQSFNGNKFSSYMVWYNITQETDKKWPQYSDDAHARFACEMTQVLFAAVIGGYQRDEQVRMLQQEIKRDGHLMTKKNVSSPKMRLVSWLVSRHYGLMLHFSSVLGSNYRKRYGMQ